MVDADSKPVITLPGRKLLDIVKVLPDQVTISVEGECATVRSGKSRFTLATLPASDFVGRR